MPLFRQNNHRLKRLEDAAFAVWHATHACSHHIHHLTPAPMQWLEYAGHAGQVVRDELDAQSDAVRGMRSCSVILVLICWLAHSTLQHPSGEPLSAHTHPSAPPFPRLDSGVALHH